jgi:hypothetical protein
MAAKRNIQTVREKYPTGRSSPARTQKRWRGSHARNNKLIA